MAAIETFSSSRPSVDPTTGFSSESLTFHSLRPSVPLPPPTLPISFPSFALSLLPSPLPSTPALVNATSGLSLSYPSFISQFRTLAFSLRHRFNLSKGSVAFILSPPCLDVPVLYFALLSLGAIVCPANPLSTPQEISHQIALVNPSIIFTTSASCSKLIKISTTTIVLFDSAEFQSFLLPEEQSDFSSMDVLIHQADPAAIQFSSGTTGLVKAAAIPHRSFIAMTAGFHAMSRRPKPDVTLLVAPMFHSFGFFFALKGLAMGETLVVMGGSKVLADILGVAERWGATVMTAAPPVVVVMARSEEAKRYNLGRLERVITGGAPLSAEAALRFLARFPHVELLQGYGSTEAGGISRMIDREECKHVRSVGRLTENVEAKIVDIITGKALLVGQQGELWLRGPACMTGGYPMNKRTKKSLQNGIPTSTLSMLLTGYVGDDEANASTFDSDGWLKTGDLCYFDDDGFLYVVDRLKELIKYKGYQVPPAELECLLHSLPGIADAAIIPYPQEDVGQIPMAFVVRQPGSNLSEWQVMDYVAKQVAPYKRIRKVVFVDSIPKSAAGKILRRVLASQALRDAPMSRL